MQKVLFCNKSTMKKVITAIIGILLFILIMGCSANYHAKQAQKHIRKAKMKDPDIIFVDTVYVETITEIPRVSVDTVFSVDLDTIEIEKERLKIRYIRTTDSVYLSGECDTITVVKKVPVTLQETLTVEVTPKWVKWLKWVAVGLGIIGVLALIKRLVP